MVTLSAWGSGQESCVVPDLDPSSWILDENFGSSLGAGENFGSSLGAGGTTSGTSGGATLVSFLCWRNNFWILGRSNFGLLLFELDFLLLVLEEQLLDPPLDREPASSSLNVEGSSKGATLVSFLSWRNNFWILSLAKNILGNILLGPKFKCPGMTRAGTSRKTTNNSKFIIV